MKKVVSVSLAGRSYQVEEAGYAELQRYLEDAERRLSKNPDKEDIIGDIEQSIADKCAASLKAGKDVISAAVVKQALEKVGPVDGEAEEDMTENESAPERTRKLYALPNEGKIAGVCAGLAAYFGVDVTIMRLLFVVLLFVTQGLMILVYLAMAFAMPEAKKPEEVAEAYGRPVTAKEIVHRVKESAAANKDIVSRIGTTMTVIGQGLAAVFGLCAIVFLTIVTAGWVWAMWAVALGRVHMNDQLASLNGWSQIVLLAAVYLLIALPLYWLFRSFRMIGSGKGAGEVPKSTKSVGIISVALWLVSLMTVVSFAALYEGDVRNYVDHHGGYIDIGNHHICVDVSRCGDGVQYLKEHPEYWDENPQIDRRLLQN